MRFFWSAAIASWLSLLAACPCMAEAWVDKMFNEQEFDFGTVARGADTVHRFEVKNIYKEDVNLVSVRSSCGCTSPTLEHKTLKTGEVGYVVASFNTRTFTGPHGATLTVDVEWDDHGARRQGEAQLQVHGNIRGDLVFDPGSVHFENVDQGQAAEQLVRVTYAGNSGWKITDVRGTSRSFEVELTETQRTPDRVAYELLVRLKDKAPAGYFNDPLILVTNDSQNQRIPLDVSGRVIPEISVAPEPLLLGEVRHGEQISKKVVVRGKKPFRIVSVACDAGCFQFKTDQEDSERHIVEVVFDAKRDPGAVKETIHIATSLGEAYDTTLTAYATVVPAPADAAGSQAEQGTSVGSGEPTADYDLAGREGLGFRVQASTLPSTKP
jgi:Protein of unknown function (DUF1573)